MDGDNNDRARRLRNRAYALTDDNAWRDAHDYLRCIRRLSRPREVRAVQLIRDVAMLKGKHGFTGQERRLATRTGARLMADVISIAEPPDAPKPKRRIRADFGLEPSGATWKPNDIELLILRRLDFLPHMASPGSLPTIPT